MTRPLLAALALLAALPAGASAHATLTSTTPERGAVLDAAPRQIVLDFSEPVEAAFGAVRVYDSDGRALAVGEPFRPGGDADRVAVRLPGALGEGAYTATYRVISADSHPVSGGFVFAYGEGAGPASTVEELLAGSSSGPVTGTALSVARGLQYAAIALGAGLVLFIWLCWLPGLRSAASGAAAAAGFDRRARVLLVAAAVAGLLSAGAAVVLQGAVAGGTSAWAALDPSVVGDVLSTRFGTVNGIAAVLWVAALGAGLALGPLAAAIPLAALCAAPALGGHAGAQDPVWLLLPATIAHVAAMAAWLGGVAALVLAVRRATRALESGQERTRLLTAVVSRFSALATVAIGAIVITGIVQSVVLVASPGALLDTAFGRSVLIKIGLFAGICALGWINRQRLLPALRAAREPGRAGALLRRTLRIELATGLAVLAVTGALAGYPPSSAESSGPFSASATLGEARMELTVDPARTGANQMHVYLFSRADGSQYAKTEELTASAALPGKDIEPIELTAEESGPGHFVITGATFGVAGDWQLQIGSRVGEFDLFTTTIEVPIR